MNAIGFNKATSVRIVNLMMQETGSYNSQYGRPYNTVMDGGTINSLTERVLSSPGNKITSNSLSGLTSCFIQPQATPESEIGIANGWNEKRIRFLMEVECAYGVGGSITEYIQGYTSFSGITQSAAIAPDMVFFINSIIQTRKTHMQTPMGMQVMENVVENSHIMASNSWLDMTSPSQQRLMRPQDVFANIQTHHLPGMYDSGVGGIFDSRSVLRQEAVKSRRSNGLPSIFASSIMDGYLQSTELSDFGQDELKILNQSRGYVTEKQAATDPFLAAITSITNNVVSNTFKYSDLQKLDYNVNNVTNYKVTGPLQQANMHHTGMTANWGGSDRVTQAATILSQSVPAVMMELLLNNIVFKSTNHTMNGMPETHIVNARSFSQALDLTRNFSLFISRLELEILNDLTFGNSVSYTLEMKVDLLGDTWISISLDDSGAIDYVSPSFCDNLLVPVITSNPQTVQQLANDFETLTSNLKEAVGGQLGTLPQTNVLTTDYQINGSGNYQQQIVTTV